MNIGDLFVRIHPDEKQFEREMQRSATKAGDKAGRTLGQRMSAGLKKHGTMLATGGGMAAGYFIAGAVQEFGKFDKQMREVFTLLPGIAKPAMDEMTSDVKDFANEFGVLPDEVVPALYQSLSAGVPQDNVFEFLATANKLAVGGVATTSEAVGVLAAVTKGYGDTTEEATRKASDLLFTTVKLGTTTIPELSSAIGKAIPLAATLGIKQEELFAATAALTGVTGNTAEVITQLRAAETALLKERPQMTAMLKEHGYESGQAAVESLGFKGALDLIVESADGNNTALGKMLGSAEAMTAVLALTGARAEAFSYNIDEMTDSTGATDEAFATMADGISYEAQKIAARVKTMALSIGEEFQALGPLLIAFGPSMGRALGAGLGGIAGLLTTGLIKAWGKVGGPVLRKAIGVVGAVSGSIYSAAVSVASKLGAVLSSAWAKAVGSSGIIGTAARTGAMVGTAFSFALKGALVLGLALAAGFIGQEVGRIARQTLTDIGRDTLGVDLGMDLADKRVQQRAEWERFAELSGRDFAEFMDHMAAERIRLMEEKGILPEGIGMFGDATAKMEEAFRQMGGRAQFQFDEEVFANVFANLSTDDLAEQFGDFVTEGMEAADLSDEAQAELNALIAEATEGLASFEEEAFGAAGALGGLGDEAEGFIGAVHDMDLSGGVTSMGALKTAANEAIERWKVLRQQPDKTEKQLKRLYEKRDKWIRKYWAALEREDEQEAEFALNEVARYTTAIEHRQGIVDALSTEEGQVAALEKALGLLPETATTSVTVNGVRTAINSVTTLWERLKAVFGADGQAGVTVKWIGDPPEHLQHGGRALAGRPYVVGEERPELFVPDQSGYVYPEVPIAERVLTSTVFLDITEGAAQALRSAGYDANAVADLLREATTTATMTYEGAR